jgi:hypothetical protein
VSSRQGWSGILAITVNRNLQSSIILKLTEEHRLSEWVIHRKLRNCRWAVDLHGELRRSFSSDGVYDRLGYTLIGIDSTTARFYHLFCPDGPYRMVRANSENIPTTEVRHLAPVPVRSGAGGCVAKSRSRSLTGTAKCMNGCAQSAMTRASR